MIRKAFKYTGDFERLSVEIYQFSYQAQQHNERGDVVILVEDNIEYITLLDRAIQDLRSSFMIVTGDGNRVELAEDEPIGVRDEWYQNMKIGINGFLYAVAIMDWKPNDAHT